ncbi:MAG: outer membrane beta-barrel protein [Bacteroidia bacterium]|jgi:hypothetical protein|nr:outer membrane beta-barrel protein [Bacteroidia bacterium]
MRNKWQFLFILILVTNNLWSQVDSTDNSDEPFFWNKPSEDEKSRLGIKMGMQVSSLFGSALPDNALRFGLLGGGYGRINFKKGWSVQQELQISFKGSNFNFPANQISAMKLLYVDAPFIIFKQLKKQSPHKIGLGVSYARLINSVLFVNDNPYPTGNQIDIDKNDWLAVGAYQYQFEYFALQGAAKYGLRNLNLGNPWPDNSKPINNNGTLTNFTIEFSIIF